MKNKTLISFLVMSLIPILSFGVIPKDIPSEYVFSIDSIRLTGQSQVTGDDKVQFRVKENGFDYENYKVASDWVVGTGDNETSDHYSNSEAFTIPSSKAKKFEIIPVIYNEEKDTINEISLSNVVGNEVALWIDDGLEWTKINDNYFLDGTQSIDGGDIAGIVIISLFGVGGLVVGYLLFIKTRKMKVGGK